MKQHKENENSWLELREIITKETNRDGVHVTSRWIKVDEEVNLGSIKEPLHPEIVEFKWTVPQEDGKNNRRK